VEFFNMLTGPELLELTEAHLPDIASGCIRRR
jgi:hypothetical protein